jgi:hypothetical protein
MGCKMAQRTWIPQLIKILRKTCQYILRWRTQLGKFIPDESEPLLDAVVTACQALEEVLVEL